MTIRQLILREIAFARSGDKGSSANIGVIAFDTKGYALLQRYLTAERVETYFKSLGVRSTIRYELPNLLALNFVLQGVLDGGGSLSLRLDSQGKALGQALLEMPLEVNTELSNPLQKCPGDGSSVKISYPLPSVAQLTLNRPEKRNAFNVEMLEELADAIEKINADDSLRVLLLTASGTAFCTGMDLNEAADPKKIELSALLIARCLKELYRSRHATIAVVQGAAVGGGAGFASACDIVAASPGAIFGYPEVRRGLVPAQVAALLVRQIGLRHARELLLTGELVDAARAEVLGMVNRIVDDENLLSEALKIAGEFLKGAPGAITRTKRLLEALDPVPFDLAIDTALSFHKAARCSVEAQEGVNAFLDKRPPSWVPGIS